MKQPTTNDWLEDVRRELADHQRQVADGVTFDGYEWLTKRRLVERIDELESIISKIDALRNATY